MLRYFLVYAFTLFSVYASAQHYSGYYVSDPPLEDYHHFKIHQEHNGSELLVKGFSEHNELWSLRAPLLSETESQKLIEQFADHADIEKVYRISLLLDGADWEFLLLGYRDNKRDHGAFKVIEEIFEHEDDPEPELINKFEWYKSHHHAQ